jgi:hypothetical protein
MTQDPQITALHVTTVPVTTEQRGILRHALGLGRGQREYRNHFVTGPGGTDYPLCEALVATGLMRRYEGNPLTGGDPYYVVTDGGRLVAREVDHD